MIKYGRNLNHCKNMRHL